MAVACPANRFYGGEVRDPLADPKPLIDRVYAYAAYRLGAGADAEDVTSETFERALRYRASFDSKRGDPAAWLVGIARRCIADRALREVQTDIAPEGVVESHERATIRGLELAAAVATLSDRDRDIVALRFGADMPVREIAAILELRTNTVEVALHRALARLRAELDVPTDSGDPRAERCAATPAPGNR